MWQDDMVMKARGQEGDDPPFRLIMISMTKVLIGLL